jgi:formylglycine-generating enzyme required for sulfatase activity
VLNASIFSGSARQVPARIDPGRKSATALGLYDLFGNAAEWCRGASDQPVTMGGSIFNLKPKPEVALARLRDVNVPPDAINSGSPVIGFRCVLKAPLQ